ncbi:MAG: glycosyltransferase family 4 protein [Bacteroidales bacterium]|nr:glycosyltransferase family 4 protein [Bacteroidales bacterium]
MERVYEHKKNVLLYLGKFPGYGFDVDGGSILARQLIDILKTRCNLTVVFIRKNGETYTDSQVREIRYVEYKNPFGNKFVRRLQNLDTNREAIGDYTEYDIIITAHVSKFFGFENASSIFWDKTILFPMFCTKSYKRAGEYVPLEYTEHEQFVLTHVRTIITPSEIEMEDLVLDYSLNSNNVKVVYRGINPMFKPLGRSRYLNKPQLVCIGSIKKQKNNIAALYVLDLLVRKGIDCSLNIICTIQEQNLYEELLGFIRDNSLTERVNFFFEQTQEQVAQIVQNSDINISVSNWETFGRGIFEGVSCGLPTFVYSKLTAVRKICEGNQGIRFVNNTEEMATEIECVLNSPKKYLLMSDSLKVLANAVSSEREKNKLISILLKD